MWTRIVQYLIRCSWLLIAAGSALAGTGLGESPSRILKTAEEDLRGAVWLLEDPGGALTIDDIRTTAVQGRFKHWDPARGDVNLSFSQSAWWLRIRLARGPEAPSTWVLNVPYAFNKFIDFHTPEGPPVLTGHARPLENRPLLSQHFAFPVTLGEAPQDFYFRVASNYAISFPLTAWHPSAYARDTMRGRLPQALYHGALIAMTIFAAFIWVVSRDARFGHYALYGTTLNLSMLTGNGWGGVLLWPGWRDFDEVSPGFFMSLTASTSLLLIMRVLQTRETMPRAVHQAARWSAALAAVHAGLMLASTGHPGVVALLYQSLLAVGLTVIIIISLALWHSRRHHIAGRGYFVAGLLVFALGVLVATLRIAGWLPTNGFTSYAVQIATAIEMMLLSFMLVSIVREERKQSIASQSDLIGALRAQEQRLEQSVVERTQALTEAAESERKTLSEYLRFAALVSHEFRNGLNVISAQSDMLRKQNDDPAIGTRTRIIRQHVSRLAKITDTWLKSDQIQNAPKPPDIEAIDSRSFIHECLEQTSEELARHRLDWSVDDNAATIWADRQSLEVVLVNLLSNACKYSAPGSRILIGTRARITDGGERLTGLQVRDEGEGIAPTYHSRIFDRYFRIQPEGAVSGTGLGLSFVRHIAEQHGGLIELESEPGRGSTFTVWFPDRGPR